MNDIIDIWKKSIEVQQHFNDIELKIRNYALTIFSLIVTAVGYSFNKDIIIDLGSYKIILPVIIGYVGSVILWAFYFMDRFWYHNLLVGAVKQTIYIEDKYKENLPEMQLSTKIGNESPIIICDKYKIHSSQKIDIFYFILIYLLLFGATVMWCCLCENICNRVLLTLIILFFIYHTFTLIFGKFDDSIDKH